MTSDGALERRTLGRTGLEVTAVGFGTGGFSRAGLRDGIDHAAAVIAEALDAGVNLIDTAEMYGTERAVARGIERSAHARENLVVTTKVDYRVAGRLRTPGEIAAAVQARLEALETDYLDVVQVHGLALEHYEQVRDELLPVLEQARAAGTVRWIGVTEAFRSDRGHEMLARAIADGCWDVVMVGFNLLNQTARARVLEPALAANIGVMDMFAVRQALRDLDVVSIHLRDQLANGTLPAMVNVEAELARLVRHVGQAAATLPDLAYRFVRDEPGISTVLMGTGNPAHLRANLESFARPPLDASVVEALRGLLRGIDTLNGETGSPFAGDGTRPG